MIAIYSSRKTPGFIWGRLVRFGERKEILDDVIPSQSKTRQSNIWYKSSERE